MTRPDIPEAEFAYLCAEIVERSQLMDPEYLAACYRALGLRVITDPFDPELVAPVFAALRDGAPYLLIRMGDGEMNLFAYGTDPGTPTLDRVVSEEAVMTSVERFRVTDATPSQMRLAMLASVDAADAVGVVGLWRARPASVAQMTDHSLELLRSSVRAISGHWRGIAAMLDHAATGALSGKLICPVHAYFGLARHLHALVTTARATLCISNRPAAVERLRTLCPGRPVRLVELKAHQIPERALSDATDFLRAVEDRLEPDLSGQLVLIGAGPWAEFFGEMVRQRGGVAVDFGSAFDLLEGNLSRPIHQRYLKDRGLRAADMFAPLDRIE